MVHSDELALELADADPVTVGDDALRNVPQTVLTQLLRQQRQRQFGPDEWDIGSLSQQVRHSADVILVTVSEHQADHVVQPLADGVEARQDQIDARMIIFGKQHAAVDQQQLAVELHNGHVAADVAQTAQRDDAHRVRRQQGRDLQATGGHGRKGTGRIASRP